MEAYLGPEAIELRNKVINQLLSFGFKYDEGCLSPPSTSDKDAVRRLHSERRTYILMSNRDWILKNENKVFKYFADGNEVSPEAIEPVLIEIGNSRLHSDLFRYATYLWSIPVSRGFGRSMRYLVMDKSNEKLIGIFGLTDPVIGLKDRDEWIGWTKEQKENRLWHVLDSYILGAVPPYSDLLGAKLVASLITSNEVRSDFRKKYEGKPAVISGKVREGELVLATTNTALGKSSVLNRLKYDDRLTWQHIGWTGGYGHFHLDTGLVDDMMEYLRSISDPVVEKNRFGDGPQWKLRVIRHCLRAIELNPNLVRHGVRRGFYAAPLASNFREYLLGGTDSPDYYDAPMSDLYDYFRTRYLIPRSKRITCWRLHKASEIKVSNKLREIEGSSTLEGGPRSVW